MSEYRTPDSKRLTICDDCGKAPDGSRPDLAKLTKWDHTAELLAQGFPEGTTLQVSDYCPECTAARDVRLLRAARVH